MAIDDNKIQISVDVAGAEAVQILNGVEKSINGVSDAAKQADTTVSDAESSFSKLLSTSFNIDKALLGLSAAAIGAGVAFLKVAEHGDQVADLQDGFAALGGTSEAIDKAAKATNGLISNTDLLTIANKALISDLPDANKNFALISEAGVKLANVMGVDAKQGVEQLTQALVGGRVEMLRKIGVMVDDEKAIAQYTATNQIAGRELTDLEKKTAIQTEALKQLAEVTKGLPPVNDSVSDSFSKIQVALTNTYDKVAVGISENPKLQKTFNDLATAINEVDTTKIIEGIQQIINAAVDGIKFINGLADSISMFSKGVAISGQSFSTAYEGVNKELRINNMQLSENDRQLAKTIQEMGKFAGKADLSGKEIAELNEKYKLATTIAAKYGDVHPVIADRLTKLGKAIQFETDLITVNKSEVDKLVLANGKQATAIAEVVDAETKGNKPKKEAVALTKDQIKELEKQEKASRELADTLSGKAEKALKVFEDQLIALKAANPEKDINMLANSLGDVASQAMAAGNGLADIKKTIEKASKSGGGFFEGLFKPSGDVSDLSQSMQDTLLNGISGALSSIKEGGSLDPQLQAAGASLGAAAGAALGGPAGAELGKVLGDEIGKGIGQLGEGTSESISGLSKIFAPGTTLIFGKQIDEFIGKVFGGKNNRASNAREGIIKTLQESVKGLGGEFKLLVDNEFKNIDFVFSGDLRKAFNPDDLGLTLLDTAFQGVSETAKAGFLGVGDALTTLSGTSEQIAGQIGALLADELGGDLNNLQLALQATGVTAEQLQTAITDAYLNGKVEASDFLNQSAQIEEVYKEGIPGAMGAVDQAFKNFAKGGAVSGRVAMDAIRDAAIEAGEASITSIQGLRDKLIAAGNDAGEVDKYLKALSDNGIDSIEKMKNITVQQTAAVVASANNQAFAFENTYESVKKTADELRKLPDEKTINVKYKVSAEYASSEAEKISKDEFGQTPKGA